MGFLNRFSNLFSKSGRDDELLLKAMEHAKAGRPQQAIAIYDTLIKSNASGDTVRARALFNRALAYSSLKDDAHALTDLKALLALPSVPDNVRNSATDQLKRVQKRSDKPAR
jgi:hypothetical protein